MKEFAIKDFNGDYVDFNYTNKDWTEEFKKIDNEILYIDTNSISEKDLKCLNKIVSDNEIMSKYFKSFNFDERTKILTLITRKPKLTSLGELKKYLSE